MLEWLPSPKLRFRIRMPQDPSRDFKLAVDLVLKQSETQSSELELPDIGKTFPTFLPVAGHIPGSELEISGSVAGEIVTGTETGISSLLFHLPNVPECARSADRFVHRTENAIGSWERVVLRCDGWVVTLDPVENEEEVLKSASAARGYAITRVGKLERANGKTFSLKTARPVLEVLTYVLSFAFERWCPPMLLIGLGRDGQRRCELWSPCRMGAYQTHIGWFDFHHPNALSDLFAALQRRWKDEQVRQAFKDAIYWFIEIHRQPLHIETGIVLGQITLEMLGWLLLVEQTPIISENSFERLPAADKLKLLLSSCSIPINTPPELDALHKVAKTENWQGPDVLVTVRNSIVHVNKKKREQSGKKKLSEETLHDSHALICWYIELLLLRQLEYEGEYSNRLKQRIVGQTEPVPWASD